MRYIIIGQSMLWLNLAGIYIGWLLFGGIPSSYVSAVMGVIGAVGSAANLFFSISLQVHGYQSLNVIEPSQYMKNKFYLGLLLVWFLISCHPYPNKNVIKPDKTKATFR